jgi:hypothetical protein
MAFGDMPLMGAHLRREVPLPANTACTMQRRRELCVAWIACSPPAWSHRCCNPAPMGGKRNKGVGQARPNKKKRTPLLPAAEVSMEAEESEDEPDLTQEPPPEPEPSPPPSPEPAPPTRDETKQIRSSGAKARMAKAREQLREAECQLQVSERRWKRKKQTYHHSGKYSVWDQPSIVERVQQRMFAADVELGKARAEVAFRRDRLTRWRSFYVLTKRMDENPQAFVADYNLMGFWLRSVRRIADMPTAPASWRSGWPVSYKYNIYEWSTMHFGMAVPWDLMHAETLKATYESEEAAADDAAIHEEGERPQTRQSSAEMFEAQRAASARAFANS